MDITLAKTFLAISEQGSFAKASEQLYVTQSTISTRVKQLEDLLGQTLFHRSKSGAVLTPAGAQFKPFAQKMVQTWEQACQEVALPQAFEARLSVGVQFTLWERLMIDWLPWIKKAVPDYAIMANVGASENLMQQLVNGLLDLVITYTPQNRTGLVVEQIMEESLVLVSDSLTHYGPDDRNYLFIDWGAEFKMDHARHFPDRDMARLTTNYGPLAVQYLLSQGGSAYLPLRMVRPFITDGRLHLIENEASFTRSAYCVFVDGEDNARFDTALEGLRLVAATEEDR
ncbi:MAG: LysR family transcriptional regulator [Methylocystaceae bacterium]|nr:LysR family transcriptional regulator [Methylocystaceae bacterium]